MKKLLLSILAIIFLLSPAQFAAAHELVTDDTKTKGAIFHTDPDDDPVAGQKVALYFDGQNQLLGTGSTVKLTIGRPDGKSDQVATSIDGSLATAAYVFPVQGEYKLVFTVTSDGNAYTFRQSQQVLGSATPESLGNSQYGWAKVLLLASGVGFVLIVVMVFRRRREIARSSKM